MIEQPHTTESVELSLSQLMVSGNAGGDLKSSSSSLALSNRGDQQQQQQGDKEDEIQVWISYENKDSQERQTTIVRMMAGETIADVKLRVQAKKGWFASHQRLTFGDMELEDTKTIELVARAAGIYGSCFEESNHIHLSVHLADILNVHIKTLQGHATLSARPENTVREIKEAVNLMNGYLPDHQHVFHNGQILEDSKSLADQVSPSSSPIVHVLVKRTTKVKIQRPNTGNEFELSISAVETVESLKRRIEAAEGITALDHRVVHNGQYLPETASLADYGVDEESVLVLEPVSKYPIQSTEERAAAIENIDESLQKCLNMMKQAQAGFDMHMAPCLASAGTGGAYFLMDPQGAKVAVFKPEDEEPNAENNPRGRSAPRSISSGSMSMSSSRSSTSSSSSSATTTSSNEGLRKGTLPGEGALREFAAYLLDHDNVATVPPTAMVCLKQTSNKKYASVDWHGNQGKRGSLQMFVPYEADCEEMGVSQFKKHEVHKIALLDIRLANTDRNASNMLARRLPVPAEGSPGPGQEWTLVPIDHGYCLPGSLSDIAFDWIYWPQASEPFDEEMLTYIGSLDVDKDLEKLASHGIKLRPECELVFRICNILLHLGVQKGLTAYDLGNIMCRQTMQQSILEKISNQALKKLSKGRFLQGTGKLQLHEVDSSMEELYIEEMTRGIREYLQEVFEDS
jgi:hypothetical protein